MAASPEPARPLRKPVVLALALLTVAALALRLATIDSGLPQRTDPDSIVFHARVTRLEHGSRNPERASTFGFYPLLVARVTALVFDPVTNSPPARNLEEHFERASAAHVHL